MNMPMPSRATVRPFIRSLSEGSSTTAKVGSQDSTWLAKTASTVSTAGFRILPGDFPMLSHKSQGQLVQPLGEPGFVSTESSNAAPEANSTIEAMYDAYAQRLLRDIHGIFRRAVYEDFEYGMESEFISSLQEKLINFNTKAVEAIAHVILTEQVPPRVASEALRWMGEVDHPQSHLLRLALLMHSLWSPSIWVRDGAVLGLDAMNDRHSIPALTQALQRESHRGLCQDMENVLRRLGTNS